MYHVSVRGKYINAWVCSVFSSCIKMRHDVAIVVSLLYTLRDHGEMLKGGDVDVRVRGVRGNPHLAVLLCKCVIYVLLYAAMRLATVFQHNNDHVTM
jgi:hypothetical protein